MREAVRRIKEYTTGFDRVRFEQDARTQDAVIRNLGVIGSVMHEIQEHSPDIMVANPRVPWALALGICAPATRDYRDIDIDKVWQAIEAGIPILEPELVKVATSDIAPRSVGGQPASAGWSHPSDGGSIPSNATEPAGKLIAHIHDAGDVERPFGDWVGSRGSGRWIEGLTIVAESGLSNDDVEYRVIGNFGAPSQWVRGGAFCGTRGMSLPIRGLAIRLQGAAAHAYECTCAAVFTDGTEQTQVMKDDDCVTDSLAPLEALQITFRLRDLLSQDRSHDEPELEPKELMTRFESLGDNCEYGLVQRRFGAEPLDLLRFAGFRIPVEVRLPALLNALKTRFAGLGQPGSVEVYVDGPNEEYIVREHLYDLTYHTFLTTRDQEMARMVRMEESRLALLRRKLEDDLVHPRKTFVWKSNPGNSLEEILQLHRFFRECGEHVLLWVCEAPSEKAVGEVEIIEDRLLRGYVRRFAPYDNAPDIDAPPWLTVCRSAFRLVQRNGWIPRQSV